VTVFVKILAATIPKSATTTRATVVKTLANQLMVLYVFNFSALNSRIVFDRFALNKHFFNGNFCPLQTSFILCSVA
jgi:hypothetical protein